MPDASPPPYLSGPGGAGGGPLPPPGGAGTPGGPGAAGLTFDSGGGARGPSDGGKRRGLIIGVVVIVAALVVIGILAFSGGGDGGDDVEAAATGFETVVDDADFTDGVAELRRCPVGDIDELAAKVGERVDIDQEVLDGDDGASAGQGDVDYVTCSISVEPGDVRGVYGLVFGASAVPRGDYEDYLDELFADVEVEDPTGHAGGQLYAYCNDDSDAGPGNCGADLVLDEQDIVLFVVLNGGSDAADAVAALDAVRADMVSGLAEHADES